MTRARATTHHGDLHAGRRRRASEAGAHRLPGAARHRRAPHVAARLVADLVFVRIVISGIEAPHIYVYDCL